MIIKKNLILIAAAIVILGAQHAIGKIIGINGQLVATLTITLTLLSFINPNARYSTKFFSPLIWYMVSTLIAPIAVSILFMKINMEGLLLYFPRHGISLIIGFALGWLILKRKEIGGFDFLFWIYSALIVLSYVDPWIFTYIYADPANLENINISERAVGPYLSVNESVYGICIIYASNKYFRHAKGKEISQVKYILEFSMLSLLFAIMGSRAMIIYIALILVFERRRFLKYESAVVVGLCLIMSISINSAIDIPIFQRFITEGGAESSSIRLLSIEHGLSVFASSPIVGQGFGYFTPSLDKVYPHNTLILFLAENGILLSALLIIVLMKIQYPITRYKHKLEVQGLLFIAPVLVGLLFEPNIFSNRSMPIWLAVLCYATKHNHIASKIAPRKLRFK